MSVDFVKFLKEKIFDKGTASISLNNRSTDEKYSVRKYPSHDNAVENFLKDLKKDLAKPIEQKQFKFHIHEMKGFKRTSIISFIKQNNSIKDFENVFHSFYKNFGMSDLFNNFYIKADYAGKVPKNHPYNPYVLFLLKQDFTSNTAFAGDTFLNALSFNFHSNGEDYADLKESIYTFLDTHYEKAKKCYVGSYSRSEERTHSFDLAIYERVKKHINESDLRPYEKFWQNILVQEESNSLITIPNEEFFVFNVEHSYIIKNYSSITNIMYAKSSCTFACNFLNNNFSEYFFLEILRSKDESSQFVCEFKSPLLRKEDLPHFIDRGLQLHNEYNTAKNKHLINDYQDKYRERVAKIKTELEYFILKNTVPPKEEIRTRTKKI